MKKLVVVISIFIVLLFDCCGPSATFDKPQPEDVKPLSFFPKRLHGNFLTNDTDAILTVSDKLITRIYDLDIREHKDSFGADTRIVGDTLEDLASGMKFKIEYDGDTAAIQYTYIDTLFSI
ncbi:MAG: hypothetical protein ACO1NX_11135 [Chitinophagaceae bacterium]